MLSDPIVERFERDLGIVIPRKVFQRHATESHQYKAVLRTVFSFACHSPSVALEIYDIVNDNVLPVARGCDQR